MKKKLLNISGKIERIVKPLQIISEISREIGIPFFVVGATARDMILQYGYNLKSGRATFDLDIALSVPDWQTFFRFIESTKKNRSICSRKCQPTS